mmetsp:Transcript_41677/g.107888  ORF Transcript_41677/g.107888 Transcript_41677/m.107888 type:complete len:310 (+) Transcript_41677:596-1525(+)
MHRAALVARRQVLHQHHASRDRAHHVRRHRLHVRRHGPHHPHGSPWLLHVLAHGCAAPHWHWPHRHGRAGLQLRHHLVVENQGRLSRRHLHHRAHRLLHHLHPWLRHRRPHRRPRLHHGLRWQSLLRHCLQKILLRDLRRQRAWLHRRSGHRLRRHRLQLPLGRHGGDDRLRGRHLRAGAVRANRRHARHARADHHHRWWHIGQIVGHDHRRWDVRRRLVVHMWHHLHVATRAWRDHWWHARLLHDHRQDVGGSLLHHHHRRRRVGRPLLQDHARMHHRVLPRRIEVSGVDDPGSDHRHRVSLARRYRD